MQISWRVSSQQAKNLVDTPKFYVTDALELSVETARRRPRVKATLQSHRPERLRDGFDATDAHRSGSVPFLCSRSALSGDKCPRPVASVCPYHLTSPADSATSAVRCTHPLSARSVSMLRCR